ncbi:MAG TPA: PAS domain-containing protein, partial [Coxiellaceae bacterium]|nr:PAS domain-containing protein [Coxiellaceae bacterium]
MNNKLIFDQLISFVPQYIFWKDRSGIFLGCNEAFAQQFGFTDEKDIIGKSDYDFDWSPDLRDKYIADDQEVMSTGKPKLNFEELQKQPDGSMKAILVNKAPLFDQNKNIIGLLGVYLDITELKQAQENEKLALQKAVAAEEEMKRALLLFSGMQSHDLRTPLAAINMAAQLLARDLPSLVLAYEAAQKKVGSDLPQFSPRIFSFLKEVGGDILESVHAAN